MKKLQTKLLTKTISTIIGIFAATIFAIQFAFAAPLAAQFFTSSFEANVGDTIVMDLKVAPSADKPAYTVGATLKYDTSLVNFVSTTFDKNWLGLSRAPYELTDTANGVITRTAGYPEGLKQVGPFVKYTFVAKAPGKAVMKISSGMALDAENNDAGLQYKEITINIKGKAAVPTSEQAATPKTKPQTIVIDVLGATAFHVNEDYTFSVEHKLLEDQDTTGTTNITLYDVNGAEVYKDSKPFKMATNTSLNFTIPAGTLAQGDYSISADSKYDNQKTPSVGQKFVGVLNQSEKIIDKTVVVQTIPLYMWIIIAILLIVLFLVYVHKKSKKFRNFIKNF
jgi:hypothetical protein